MLVTTGWLLAGCSTLSTVNPVNWWHRQEGGKIAEERPPPPGADQPYPNLSTVPAKPAVPDAEALKKLTASLIADRTNAQHAAQSAPLADPSSPAASPALFGVGTIPPPPPTTDTASAPTASATMPAANAPAPPPSDSNQTAGSQTAVSPSASPRKPVQSAPLEQPPAPGSTASSPDRTTPQPDLPAGPPVRPAVAGTSPPVPPDVPAPMPFASAGPSATIVFVDGASDLSLPAADEVKAFAAKRGTSTIGVTGFGDATASDPDIQSAAVRLGLSRALVIAETLKAAGVPENAIRVGAEASGRGAALRLLQ